MDEFWRRVGDFTPVEWVQVISAIGTVAAAVVGLLAAFAARRSAKFAEKQLPELQKQVEASNVQAKAAQEQIELAQKAANAAVAAVRETTRTRADQQAPRVIVAALAPEWPPFVDQARGGMPFADELRLNDPASFERARRDMTEFYLTEHGHWFMWFAGFGHVINEGVTTARVRLNGEMEFVKHDLKVSARAFASYPLSEAERINNPERNEYLVPPKTTAMFRWAVGCPVREWAEKHDAPHAAGGSFSVDVWSYGDAGVLDSFTTEFSARPLIPGRGGENHWTLADNPAEKLGVVTYPMKRQWLFEKD
ncbi:hypothetical protein [Lentzea sp. NPDC051838]|uniref:hypothetical protein n=1 Tax=Lentzea sp. NPDC051838 TaxID=3154849 RepID=UPI00343A24F1